MTGLHSSIVEFHPEDSLLPNTACRRKQWAPNIPLFCPQTCHHLFYNMHVIWQRWANRTRKYLLVSACAMMSSAIYGCCACANYYCPVMRTKRSAIARSVARFNGRAHNVSRQYTNKAQNWILLPDKVEEWENSLIIPRRYTDVWGNSVIITRQSTNQKRVFPSDI